MTVKIYTVSSHKGCRDAVAFFKKYNIPFEELKVEKENFSVDTVKEIIKVFGLEDIFATRSKSYSKFRELLEYDEVITMKSIYQFIEKHPRVLKFPLIYDHKRKCIGYQEDDIRAFLPRHIKQREFSSVLYLLQNESA